MTTIGIIGAGRAATLHAEAIRATPDTRLAGVAARSPDSPRAAALAEALRCRVLTVPQLLQVCDAAVVAAPPLTRAEILRELSASTKLKAVLIESPAATTLDAITELPAVFDEHQIAEHQIAEHQIRQIMSAAHLLHAAAVKRMLEVISTMNPHHLQMRLSLPTPARGASDQLAFGGGVLMDQTPGFWPVLLTALGSDAVSVSVPRFELNNAIDCAADVTIQGANDRQASAVLRWGASVAQASFEAADIQQVARVNIWPTPVVEINGIPDSLPDNQFRRANLGANPLIALGYVTQIENLVKVSCGQTKAWPDLSMASSALAISAAAALSIQRNGTEISISEIPANLSPSQILQA